MGNEIFVMKNLPLGFGEYSDRCDFSCINPSLAPLYKEPKTTLPESKNGGSLYNAQVLTTIEVKNPFWIIPKHFP